MRRWLLISAGAITALLVVLLARKAGDGAPHAAVAGPVVETHPTDRPGGAAAPLPGLPPEPTAVPDLTGNAELDRMVRDLVTNSDAELDEKLAAVDKEISDRKLVERANDGTISAADHAALGALLRRSNAVNIVKTQRLIAKLDALDHE
jgi:hypothetical protein